MFKQKVTDLKIDAIPAHNFYIDFDTLVDVFLEKLEGQVTNDPNTWHVLFEELTLYLEDLVSVIQPSRLLMISFDEVSPLACLQESRSRHWSRLHALKNDPTILFDRLHFYLQH